MEKKEPLVSVIIPVYNPGEGVKKCIDSVLNQTLQNIEIIFIDDLGTDNSMETVRNAAKTDPRIVILVNEVNSGPGYSRNRGIEEARGEYVSFIDPDDYVAEDFLELLYRKAEKTKPDIVKGDRIHIDECGNIYHESTEISLNTRIRKGLSEGSRIFSLFLYNHWTAIYRRALLTESGARYGLARNSEDSVFLLRACFAAKTIEIEEKAIYYYVSRDYSRMNDCSAFRLQQELISFTDMISFIQSHYDGSYEQRLYVTTLIQYHLRVQAWAAQTEEIRDDAKDYLDKLRIYTTNLSFADDLQKMDPLVDVLISRNYNLSIFPYRIQGMQQPIESNAEVIKRWADFMNLYPENASNDRLGYYWRKLYACTLSDPRLLQKGFSRSRKKQLYGKIRKLTKIVKDISMLKECRSISLFIATGINFFAFKNKIKKKPILKKTYRYILKHLGAKR